MEKQRTLAKEIKIQNLIRQRNFITKQLLKIKGGIKDGDTTYRYVGHVFEENVAYFESEGFKVTKVESDMMTAKHDGKPAYLFVVGDVELSDDEMKEAEAIKIKEAEDEPHCGSFDALMSSILGGGGFAN